MSRKRIRVDGEQSRAKILTAAVRLATVEGIERLSLARLAAETGMSKSGVFGLFGSKQVLQLATIDAAREIFIAEVIAPALDRELGREQLLALCEGFLDYIARRQWPEGCFFASVAAEVGAGDGPLRDRVAEGQKEWVGLLAYNARRAIEGGQLSGASDPDGIALELSTMLTGIDIAYLLHRDAELLERIRVIIRERLEEGA
jgi:AcrR family transcriptional regulator